MREGIAEVPYYLWRLKQDGEISTEEYWDSDLRADLQEAVKEELEAELTGEESSTQVKDLTREIIDDELR